MNDSSKPFVIPVFIPYAGCPHRCVFCNQTAITGTKKPPDAAELRAIVQQFLPYNHRRRKPVQLALFGGNFLGLKAETITAILNETESFVREGSIDNIRFSTRPDTITPETLDRISDFSVGTIELGIQSMDDTVLNLSQRGHTAGQSETALRLLKHRGYETGAQIMIGLPGDTGPQSIETAEILALLAPDFVRIYPAVVLSGSMLANWYQQGRYTPVTIEEAVRLVSELYKIFERHHIPVIRMGLQPTEELNSSATVVAGPYHPAFGHLVLSNRYLEKAVRVINDCTGHSRELALTVHPRDVSKLRGLRNDNIRQLKERFGLQSIHVVKDRSLVPGQISCNRR